RNNVLSVSLTQKMNTAIDAGTVVGEFDEQNRIVEMLRETKGRISGPNGAASRLGLRRTTLLYRMEKFGINARQFRIVSAVKSLMCDKICNPKNLSNSQDSL